MQNFLKIDLHHKLHENKDIWNVVECIECPQWPLDIDIQVKK